tara:strand:+ start:510 stop:872 length:363 start_codon:yes stop_codon:yes gene_type:complete
MTVKELRLGNWVNFKFSDSNSNVMICHNDLKNFERNIRIGEFNNIYKPIPLTEEWLLRFGFRDLGYGEWEKGDIILDNEYTDKGIWNIRETVSHLSIDVKYVHQLQNLYFALTGEELTIK